MSCAHCGKPTYPEGRVCVNAHGQDFCSMPCADAWERDPANAAAVAESYRKGNCSAYAECVAKHMMLDVEPGHLPRFASCDAECPLRVVRSRS